MTWILLNKRWVVILILSVLYVIQIAYTNHLSKKLNEAAAECTTKIQKIEQAQQEALLKAQNQANQVSADYEAAKAEQQIKVETVTREVQKIVERPVYLNNCFDDGGLQQLNSLIKADNPE
ncbi:hypothetical protein GCM10023206_06620 [Acinetobacter puyangensis]|uniref:Bacteriophage Rz lysis protein n=1 Tax=Acinetobacter puyangensis TaxID=1096779 RepID=A0A240E7R8_9GAMM|nr:hypothetical protein [Acinetobacter puyangensis]SNX44259.1 hypothetical protein SAMN05421731_102420 [Acinetobacter puyangensis]